MPEWLQKMLKRIAEWWKKFNNKQRALMISVAAVVIIALVILAYVVSCPQWVTIYTAETMKEASEVNDILTSSGVSYQTVDAGMTFQVAQADEATACYSLAQNDIASVSYSIQNVVDGSFSRTEADKQKLYKDYQEQKFEDHLKQFSFVKSATVDITVPDTSGTILASQEQSTAAVKLELNGTIDEDQAYGLALFVATELGNDGTEGVTIVDQDGNVLYSAEHAGTAPGTTSSQISSTQKTVNFMRNEVEQYLQAFPLFSSVQVSMQVDVDYSNSQEITTEYYGNEDGSNTGMIDSTSEYTASGNGSYNGVPGTDSNDDTTYYIDSDGNTYYEVSDTQTQYLTNKRETTTIREGGEINHDKTTVSVVTTRNVIYNEDQLRAQGELDDITFEEFKASKSEPVKLEVDDEWVNGVAKAAGIPTDNVQFIFYENPVFESTEQSAFSLSTLLQILLAVLIVGLLGYVVIRSTRRTDEPEPEPEISVEKLLEATGENQDILADIGYSEKSETRILIEKFVDENPDAVAQLLRNWLNEDWE